MPAGHSPSSNSSVVVSNRLSAASSVVPVEVSVELSSVVVEFVVELLAVAVVSSASVGSSGWTTG